MNTVAIRAKAARRWRLKLSIMTDRQRTVQRYNWALRSSVVSKAIPETMQGVMPHTRWWYIAMS